MHDFVQNSVFSRRWPRFCHFCTGPTTFKRFSAKCTSLRSGCTVIFALGATSLSFFRQVHEFVENSVSSPRSAGTVIFALGAPLINSFQQSAGVCPKSKTAFLAWDQHLLSFSHCAHHLLVIFSKKHEFVLNGVFSRRSGRFVIFALWEHFLAIFSKVHDFLRNKSFQPEMTTLLSFLHWAHNF